LESVPAELRRVQDRLIRSILAAVRRVRSVRSGDWHAGHALGRC
jgi:hypothetical protein